MKSWEIKLFMLISRMICQVALTFIVIFPSFKYAHSFTSLIIIAQRYTSYIKVMTLSGLTLVALKEAMMKSSVFHFMTAAITILIK